jgi:hypothetical protein
MSENPLIFCDMTDAPDTPEERLAEYRRLFAADGPLDGRERTDGGIRFRFRADKADKADKADEGVEAWVRDLAAREKACCGFYSFTVEVQGDEVWWDAWVVDDDLARQVLDEMFALPDTLAAGGVPAVEGLQIRTSAS